MRSIPALALTASLLATASAVAQPGAGSTPIARDSAPPASSHLNAAAAQALLNDVSSSYDQMEKNLEQQFGKLTQQAKSSITALEDKIRDLESQIQTLKQAATKIDLLAQKIQELLPKIMAAVGTDPGGALRRTPSTKEDQLAAQLRAELAGLGAGASSDQVSKIVDALAKGGSGGMALATQIVTRIAEARSKQIDGQINSAAAAIKPQVDQVSALEKQLAKLDQDKARALADLRTQRGKALADAAKAQDARLAIPTSIPTPKKP